MSRVANIAKFGAGFIVFVILAGLTGWITLTVMTSGGDVHVPDVAGLTLQNAISSLQNNHLYIILDGEEVHNQAPRGTVIAQNPVAGVLRKRFSTVRVIISAGPRRLEMPDLRGYGIRQARIEAGKFVDGQFIEYFLNHSDYSEGEVIAHIPGPYEVIVPNSDVSLLVSSGPEKHRYRMPDCIGLTLSETRGILQTFSSRLDIIVSDRREFGPGIVIDQVPQPGSPLLLSDRITLTVTSQDTGSVYSKRFFWRVPEGNRTKNMLVTYTLRGRTEILSERDVEPDEEIVLNVPSTGSGVLEIHLDGSVVLSEVH